MHQLWVLLLSLCAFCILGVMQVSAELTPDHKKQLTEIGKEASQAAAQIRAKEYDAADQHLLALKTRLDQIVKEAEVTHRDSAVKKVLTVIERQNKALEKATGTKSKLTVAAETEMAKEGANSMFAKDIAPIIQDRCLTCHSAENPRNGLRLDTVGGWVRGGRSGPLLVPGNPEASLIMARLNLPQGRGRMPATGEALTDDQKQKIYTWIASGASAQGLSPATTLSSLTGRKDSQDVVIPRPKGTETVSFTKDIAPWMAVLCLRCHNANQQSGGLSLENFHEMMKGGESGEVIHPGDKENSRMYRLVGGLETPRMPQGNSALFPENFQAFQKWFEEGNTFDGDDPRTPIRNYVLTDAQRAAERFGKMSEAEMNTLRIETTEAQLKSGGITNASNPLINDQFLVTGDVPAARLTEVQKWAKELTDEVRKMYPDGAGTGSGRWRGRLAIFVFKDKPTYVKFVRNVEQRQVQNDVYGHTRVTLGHEQAYVAVYDQGDMPARGPGLKEALAEQIGNAYMQRGTGLVPGWISMGVGRTLAEKYASPDRVKSWIREASANAPAISRPADLFIDGTFSPATSASVSYAFVTFLKKHQGAESFNSLTTALARGDNLSNTLRTIYNADEAMVATTFFADLKTR